MVSRLGVCTLYVDVCPGMVLQPGTNQFSSHDRSLGAYSWPWLAHFVIYRIMVIQHPTCPGSYPNKKFLFQNDLALILTHDFVIKQFPPLTLSQPNGKLQSNKALWDMKNVWCFLEKCFWEDLLVLLSFTIIKDLNKISKRSFRS